MRISIPKDYFEMFDWFKNQDETARVANLPIHSVWGWKYYGWGFQGADFLQFGIKQPLLDRDFDRWSPYNEQYYREMAQAIYSQDQNKLNNVLTKYDIAYILWDKSIIAPEQGADKRILFQPETEELLNRDSFLSQVAHFGNLLIYEVKVKNPQVRTIENPVSAGPKAIFHDDFAYTKYHDYITYSAAGKNAVFYPYRNIIDNQNRVIDEDILVKYPAPAGLDPKTSLNPHNNCPPINSREKANFQKTVVLEKSNGFIEYKSLGGSFCENFSYLNFPRNQGYLISINSRNLQGLPLRICVYNYLSRRCDLLAYLSDSKEFRQDLFLIPPLDQSMGFDINIDNFSIKNSPSLNDLESIKIYPFDYSRLSQLEDYSISAGENSEKSVLVYSQSFEPGWKAYENGKELKEHVLVNNWANGWLIENSKVKSPTFAKASAGRQNSKITIVFWPQYLEYLGFGILIATFLWLSYLTRGQK